MYLTLMMIALLNIRAILFDQNPERVLSNVLSIITLIIQVVILPYLIHILTSS